MPTYTYVCGRCGTFERVQAMLDPPLEICPQCQGAVERTISGGSGFIMKGSGRSTDCGRETPCCGRSTRCDKPPCDK